MDKLIKVDFEMPEDTPFFSEEIQAGPTDDFEVPELYRQATIDSARKTNSLRRVRKFLDDHEKKCLILQGVNGCGKSYALWAAYRHLKHNNALHDKDILVAQTDTGYKKWRTVKERMTCSILDSRTFYQEYSRHKYDEHGAALIGTLKHSPLLGIDDFGEEARTPWNMEIFGEIFDFRYQRRMPIIITTNKSRLAIKDLYPAYIISRFQEWGIFLELKDKSLREHGGFDGKDVK